jgi:phosphopantetheine adenylyltransferase
MPRRHPTCVVAGTFDLLHAGHFRLLREAFRRGRRVEVWLADDAMGAAKAAAKRQTLRPFAERCAALAAWCDAQTAAECAAADRAEREEGGGADADADADVDVDAHFPLRGRYSLHALHDAFGPSVTEPRYTAIACSEETRAGCDAINSRRAAAGLAPLEVFVAPVLLGADGIKLSSSSLREAAAAAAAAEREAAGAAGGAAGSR